MEQAIDALTERQLIAIAISAITAKAIEMGRDRPPAERWRVYEKAKWAIARLSLPPGEYEHAIISLADALKI